MTRVRRAIAALVVGLLVACGPQPTPSLVDLAEVRGFGDPVVLYEVDRAQAGILRRLERELGATLRG